MGQNQRQKRLTLRCRGDTPKSERGSTGSRSEASSSRNLFDFKFDFKSRELSIRAGAMSTEGGHLLIDSGPEARLLRLELDGLVTPADLSPLAKGWNEIVVGERGNTYVNGNDFNFSGGGPFCPGVIALATLDGSVRQVANDIHFPNGMVNSTLIVTEWFKADSPPSTSRRTAEPVESACLGRPGARRSRHVYGRRKCDLDPSVQGRQVRAAIASAGAERCWSGSSSTSSASRVCSAAATARRCSCRWRDGVVWSTWPSRSVRTRANCSPLRHRLRTPGRP